MSLQDKAVIEFELSKYLPAARITPVMDAYTDRLTRHIRYVQEFGQRMGIDPNQLAVHDKSKWEPIEFVPYALRYCSQLPEEVTAHLFARAWHHHLHQNCHHWQYWIFPQDFTILHAGMEGPVMPMPIHYITEMVADWHGAQMAYTGEWDIIKWLYKAMPTITVHSQTAVYLRGILDSLGYADAVYMQKFAHEEQ